MRNKRIRVLLGGYINNINAQDLNCRALAMFLDKEKFDVSAFLVPQQFRDFDIGDEMNGVRLIQLNRPAKILWYWIYLKGIFNCDIAYLPKGQKWRWCRFLCKLFKKKSFITVEALIDKNVPNANVVRDKYNACTKTYSITKYMSSRNFERLGIRSDGNLYLGVDIQKFINRNKAQNRDRALSNIIFIGSDIRRKRLNEFLDLANIFSNINFHVVSGQSNNTLKEYIGNKTLNNVVIHGKLSHEKLAQLLETIDIHILPSRSEGFPKVTLETAAAGVPSIVYSDYGAKEWIASGKDGYVVNTFEEIVQIIKDVQSHPEKLKSLSENAVSMASRFDWRIVVKSWEKMIEELYMTK